METNIPKDTTQEINNENLNNSDIDELPCHVMNKEMWNQMISDKEGVVKQISKLLDEFEEKYPTVQLAVHSRLYIENRPYDESIGGACQVHHIDFTWKDNSTKYSGITTI